LRAAFHLLYAVVTELSPFIDDHFAHGTPAGPGGIYPQRCSAVSAARPDQVDETIARKVFTLHDGGVGAC
jgi:hypothetical protein